MYETNFISSQTEFTSVNSCTRVQSTADDVLSMVVNDAWQVFPKNCMHLAI